MANQKLSVNDPEFVDKIIFEVKSSGHFDAFRKECLSDVDINPAYQNLHSRVEDSVQKFLNRQIYTPDTNKIRLREDMRMNVIRAGFLESGVSRIVDQVVEQKMDFIQSKVEEILYNYLGIEKPIKEEKKNGLEDDAALMPSNDLELEQVSDKTSLDSMDMKEDKEEVEEEIIDDDDFESPAFEPIGSDLMPENTQNSNLSAISGLTSQDSAENNSGKTEEEVVGENGGKVEEAKAETGLSQISTTTQDNIPDLTASAIGTSLIVSGISGEEAQMAPSLNDSMEVEEKPKDVDLPTPPVESQKSQFDLNKDVIEFTGTERKNISLDDSTNSGESEKVLQPQDVPSNTAMEIDRLYENDTTDSSEMKMEIDLKDESTQNSTRNSSRVVESSQDSLKEKSNKDYKSEKSRGEGHKSSSHRSSRHHQHSSSSSKSKHDKNRSSSHKSSSHKKISSDKERRSSSSRRDRDKESSSTKGDTKSRHKTESDDHHQEKSSSRRRKSSDHDSREEKDAVKPSSSSEKKDESKKSSSDKPKEEKLKTNENKSADDDKSKEPKSSILEKHNYLSTSRKSPKRSSQDTKKEDEFYGFANEKSETPQNPWFEVMDLMKKEKLPKLTNNSNKKSKPKPNKTANVDTNGESTGNESAPEQKSNQSQRYDENELYKPKFDFRRRRTQVNEDTVTKESTAETTTSN